MNAKPHLSAANLSPRGRYVDQSSLASLVKPGDLVFVPGSSGAPTILMDALLSEPAFTRGVRILTSYVPGINSLDLTKLHASASVTGLFMQPQFSVLQRELRYRALCMSYAAFVQHLRHCVEIDLTVVQVSPPDADGQCSLGPAVEFSPVALSKSRKRLALINRRSPQLKNSVSVSLDSFDYLCEVDSSLPVYTTTVDETTRTIAQNLGTLIDDNCVLQMGLGKVPTALSNVLGDHRGLRLHSGMLSDGLLDLHERGALDPDFSHTACVAVGSTEFYGRLGEISALRLVGCEVTHSATVLQDYAGFTAVNSALEVDLFGQCNLEHASGAAVSGIGGAPDFARAARLSKGGRSIVALNAKHKAGSRIVANLSSPAVASLARYDVDFVVSEFGVANLVGASVYERAQALIGIAAPEFRDALSRDWHALAARL